MKTEPSYSITPRLQLSSVAEAEQREEHQDPPVVPSYHGSMLQTGTFQCFHG